MGPLPVRLEVEIARVEPSSREQAQGLVRVPIALAQKLLYGEPVVEAVEVRDVEDPWGVARTVRRSLSSDGDGGLQAVEPVVVDGFEELHRSLFLALFLERTMIFVAVGLMLVVAALNLLCNVAMLAAEKRRDLAVLAGLGMPPRRIRRLFLCVGVGIGGAGATLGTVLGVGIAWSLDATGLLRLERGVFAVESVPFAVDPQTVVLVALLALVLAAGASWLPARVVAGRQPVEGFRYE
jgi:ABC-type lipoprotein release transport system permease subunit